MAKQTTILFIKALIIGLILSFIINLVPVTTAKPPSENASQFDGRQMLEAPAEKNLPGAFD